MDDEILLNDNDEPWRNYKKLMEINYRIQYGIPLKTNGKKRETKYDKILFFINKLLKQKDKQIKILTDFKYIREDFFDDIDELIRIIKKYGLSLVEEFKLDYKLNKKKPEIFKLLKSILNTISYTISSKTYKSKGKKYYSIKVKNIKFTTNELINTDIYMLNDKEYEL
jgi:hypothetical protein